MAVYTEPSDGALAAFLAAYDIGEAVSLKGIAEGIENSNFLLQTTTGSYVLTLYEARVAPPDLPYFLGLMEHLGARGVPCPLPVKARDGAALGTLAGRPAAIVTFLAGMWPRTPAPFHCRAVGEALARLHRAGADFPLHRANELSVAGWRTLSAACAPRAGEIAPGLGEELDAALAAIEPLWPRDLPAGVIHGDLFPDNVFFIGRRLSGLIDFYFACHDAFAYDLAVTLNAWCFDAGSRFQAARSEALFAGYQSVRPLTAAERAALPVLAQGAALRFALTRLYDRLNRPPGAVGAHRDALEFVARLRFQQRVSDPASYRIG